jgi:hypothetical protein
MQIPPFLSLFFFSALRSASQLKSFYNGSSFSLSSPARPRELLR